MDVTTLSRCLKTSVNDDASSVLFSPHFLLTVLPTRKAFHTHKAESFINFVTDSQFLERIKLSRRNSDNESQTEDHLITPILKQLDNSLLSQAHIDGEHTDFLLYPPSTDFLPNFENTYAVVESKRVGRLRNKYFSQRNDNTDEIYQIRNYLRSLNVTLENKGAANRVHFAILTDGILWRLYSRKYTHSKGEFENHFLEFNLEEILKLKEAKVRNQLLKLFSFFFTRSSLEGALISAQNEARELEFAVTKALREQTFTALEYIATGIWRQLYIEQDPMLIAALVKYPQIDYERVHNDENERAKLLKVVFDESLVYLLRLLFLLYGEDRELFDSTQIPKVVKGEGNLLSRINDRGAGIGQVEDPELLQRNDDVRISDTFIVLDRKYNGGLFSAEQHLLIHKLDIDNELFVNAVDNLCRVEVRGRPVTVDFSTISVRELGSIYEGLLEYELTIAAEDINKMPTVVNQKRFRYGIKAGDLYLINQDGKRKASGSYYTPDLIVEHLVKTSLTPKLEKIRTKHVSFDKVYEEVLNLSVVDPSMGSGHMLVSAFNAIISFLRKTAEGELDSNPHFNWNEERILDIRSEVARKCIYGVDLNPVAVDLAKLVLWMQIFRPDKPFEFFDYNLQCGNSLIGVEKNELETGTQFSRDGAISTTLFRNQEEVISDVQNALLQRVRIMLDLPRNSIAEIHKIEDYWKTKIVPLQRQLGFVSNISLVKWLSPEDFATANRVYFRLIDSFDADFEFVERILNHDPAVDEDLLALSEINSRLTKTYRPFHWHIRYPDIAVRGGFDVVLSNPPWDKVKANRNEFFAQYIPGYDKLPTAASAKSISDGLMKSNPAVQQSWHEYESAIANANKFYAEFYSYQRAKNQHGKSLKGDANLFKVFLERIYRILKKGGTCGIVIPDNFNIDAGATGLRRLILKQTRLRELIMFENRKRLFQIHGQYKFNVMTFDKLRPLKDGSFTAGFYWYDPIWLDNTPDGDYISSDKYNAQELHKKFRYSLDAISRFDSDTLTIFELRGKKQLRALEKIHKYPALGDTNQNLFIRTYREFDMTNDSDLFNFEGAGWPLYQGGCIHHYESEYKQPEKYVVQDDGEARLSRKWKIDDLTRMPTRAFRIAWRAIAQPTDTRSLIATVIPRGVFTGNSLNLIEILNSQREVIVSPKTIAGLNAILSSMTADFYIRLRIAKNVNAFIVQSLPVPRDTKWIEELGELALPLFQGDQFQKFRENVEILHAKDREQRRAVIDALVADGFGLTIEEFQGILDTFPNVEESYKKRCILEFKELSFQK